LPASWLSSPVGAWAREDPETRLKASQKQAGQWADRGREVVSRQKENLGAAVEAGRQAYREASSEGAAKKS